MAWFWWLFGIVILILWIAAIVDIVRRRHERSGGSTAAWLLIVIIFPIIGVIAYFIVNGVGMAGPTADMSQADPDRVPPGGRAY
jgi:type VI protein secretion system component VasK